MPKKYILHITHGRKENRVRIRIGFANLQDISETLRRVLPLFLVRGTFVADQLTLPLGFEVMKVETCSTSQGTTQRRD